MKKRFLLVLIFLLLLPNLVTAETVTKGVKVAFVRDGYLWIKMNGKEAKITKKAANYTDSPQWSYDGKWLVYQVAPEKKPSPSLESQTEIWVYNTETKKHKQITLDGTNPKWSPVENIIAFKSYYPSTKRLR